MPPPPYPQPTTPTNRLNRLNLPPDTITSALNKQHPGGVATALLVPRFWLNEVSEAAGHFDLKPAAIVPLDGEEAWDALAAVDVALTDCGEVRWRWRWRWLHVERVCLSVRLCVVACGGERGAELEYPPQQLAKNVSATSNPRPPGQRLPDSCRRPHGGSLQRPHPLGGPGHAPGGRAGGAAESGD